MATQRAKQAYIEDLIYKGVNIAMARAEIVDERVDAGPVRTKIAGAKVVRSTVPEIAGSMSQII